MYHPPSEQSGGIPSQSTDLRNSNAGKAVPVETKEEVQAGAAVKLINENTPAKVPNVTDQPSTPSMGVTDPGGPHVGSSVGKETPVAPPSIGTELHTDKKEGVPDSIATDRVVSSSNSDSEESVQRKGASVTESVPPPPPVPPSSDSVSAPLPTDTETRSGMSEDMPVPERLSSDLNELLESAKQLQENKKAGSGSSVAHDLMQINKKVAEIYKLLSNYSYDPSDRRDPFAPFQIEEEEEMAEDTREVIPSYPTGKYDLSEIKLVGIKWNSKLGPSKALFRTPDNVIHPLQKNDRIGSNRGVIYQLREDEVVILEPRVGIASKKEDAYVPIIVRLHRWMDQDKNESLDQQPSNQVDKKAKGV